MNNNCVHNGMYMQGNNMMMPPQMHPGNMPADMPLQLHPGNMPMADMPPTSSASQVHTYLYA